MAKPKIYTQDEVYEEKRKSFADGKEHRSPSPQTIAMFAEIKQILTDHIKEEGDVKKITEDELRKIGQKVDKLFTALFGDPETGERGIVSDTRELRTLFIDTPTSMGKFFKVIILVGSAIGMLSVIKSFLLR